MSEPSALRLELHQAIQRSAPFEEEGSDIAGGARLLVGWVVVAEWAASDGGRWLSMNSGDGSGQKLTSWQQGGYLHEGLYGDWPAADGAADD